MRLISVSLGAFVMVVQPWAASSQVKRPSLLIDPVAAPIAIHQFNYVESEAPRATAALTVVPSSRQQVTSALILVTYWREGRPLSGRIYPVSGDTIARAGQLLIRFDPQRTRADSVVATVFKAQGPTLVWVVPSEHLTSLRERVFPGYVIPPTP
jgi:hypothetical protein